MDYFKNFLVILVFFLIPIFLFLYFFTKKIPIGHVCFRKIFFFKISPKYSGTYIEFWPILYFVRYENGKIFLMEDNKQYLIESRISNLNIYIKLLISIELVNNKLFIKNFLPTLKNETFEKKLNDFFKTIEYENIRDIKNKTIQKLEDYGMKCQIINEDIFKLVKTDKNNKIE